MVDESKHPRIPEAWRCDPIQSSKKEEFCMVLLIGQHDEEKHIQGKQMQTTIISGGTGALWCPQPSCVTAGCPLDRHPLRLRLPRRGMRLRAPKLLGTCQQRALEHLVHREPRGHEVGKLLCHDSRPEANGGSGWGTPEEACK